MTFWQTDKASQWLDLGPIKKLKNSFNLHIIVKKIQPRTQWLQCITAIPVSPPCITADRLIHHQMYGFSFNAFAKVSQSQLSTNYLQTFLPLTLTFNFNSILIMLRHTGEVGAQNFFRQKKWQFFHQKWFIVSKLLKTVDSFFILMNITSIPLNKKIDIFKNSSPLCIEFIKAILFSQVRFTTSYLGTTIVFWSKRCPKVFSNITYF